MRTPKLLDDFARFASCVAGEGVTTPPAGCAADAFARTDLDADDDTDLADDLLFVGQITGPPACGDGFVSGLEWCDHAGESVACDIDCTLAICGDGHVNSVAGETCDDYVETLTCDTDCTAAGCGDGTINETRGEECDDANTNGGDGCSADCHTEGPLPNCVITFDEACPNDGLSHCGAVFEGNGSCAYGSAYCDDTDPNAYRVTDWEEIRFLGDVTSISVYFAARDGSEGQIIFQDATWNFVDSIAVDGDCLSQPFTTQTRTFSTPVPFVSVYAYGDEQGIVYLDTMEINPGP